MNIDKIKSFQKILNNKILKRNRKNNFKDIIYDSIYKTINNTSYDDVTYQINRGYFSNNIIENLNKKCIIYI